MRNFVITFVLACTTVVLTLSCFLAHNEKENLYPLTTEVYDISEATDTVTVIDYNGNLWQFKGVEDWNLEDICTCIMDSKGTDLIKDDEIVKVRYNGWFEGWQK